LATRSSLANGAFGMGRLFLLLQPCVGTVVRSGKPVMNGLRRVLILAAAVSASPPAPTIASLQSASRAHPGGGSAQYALGLALRKAGKHRAAIAAFDRAASLNFQAGAAQSQVTLGDRAGALKRVSVLAESQPFALEAILKAVGGIPQIEADAQFHAALAGANAKRYPCRDRNGTITNYVGELRDDAMHFHAEAFGDADGVHQIRTLAFTPNPDGSVRQLFQDSDEGKEWKTTFDGHYVRTTQ